MKHHSPASRCTALVLLAGSAVALHAAALRNNEAIAGVASGRRTEARASWWGYDPADSTTALQDAINSGVRKLVIEDMGTPWITDKLKLAGDQEIVFEKGVVVLARRGAFHGNNDCLFSAASKTNITLTGHGATLKMWKQDYDDSTRYKRAEWRNVLSFTSCSNVRVTGLTLADSGGDGIYLGSSQRGVPCSDVLIRNVSCINNYRQGISVISARNLLIEDCVLKDTGGTAPMAGIDFEPNHAWDELVNCVMRRCVSENNKGDAYAFYLPALRSESKPVSIKLENCRAIGGNHSISFSTANNSETAGVKGTAEFINCRFEGRPRSSSILIGDKPATAATVSFTHCEIVDPTETPIMLTSRRGHAAGEIGGIRFNGCTVVDPQDRLPLSYRDDAGGVGLSDISGTLAVQRGGQRTTHELTPNLIAKWMPFLSFKQIVRFNTKDARYEPALPEAKPDASRRSTARQRDLSEWLLWAGANERVTFSVLIQRVGKGGPDTVPVSLRSPSGKLTQMPGANGEKETAYEFLAVEQGAYKIVCEPLNSTATVNSSTSRVCLYSEGSAIHFLATTGPYFFWVPPGTNEFALKVSGDNAAECVKAALIDPAGNQVEEKDNISQAHQFVAKPTNTTRGEIWSLRLAKPSTGTLEDFHVQLQGIPPLFSHTRESLLQPVK